MTPIAIQFISGKLPDDDGRFVNEYIHFTAEELEKCHDWIQWAFPIDVISAYNPLAPTITADCGADYAPYRGMQDALLSHYLSGIGIFKINGEYVCVEHKFKETFNQPFTHGNLRITRILTHLRLTGRIEDAKELMLLLVGKFHNYIDQESLNLWLLACVHDGDGVLDSDQHW